jgi:MtN3 and saliva related transmembrane protein
MRGTREGSFMTPSEVGSQDAIGLAAGVLTTIAFIPQLLRILRTRSAYDVSWLMFSILSVGSVLWLWYGIRLGSLPLIVTNIVTLSLQLSIFFLKWRFGRGERSAVARSPQEPL